MASTSMNVAKASFNHVPSHQRIVTRSPNHICAVSWAMADTTRARSSSELSSLTNSAVSRYVTRPRFSIAPAAKSGTPTWSSLSEGYGIEK